MEALSATISTILWATCAVITITLIVVAIHLGPVIKADLNLVRDDSELPD